MSYNSSHYLALTVGDARGIGPELVADAIVPTRWRELVGGLDIHPWVIGPEGCGVPLDESLGVWSPSGDSDADRAQAGRFAGLAIERAVRNAMNLRCSGIVTAPIDKRALSDGGYKWPGHTEMLAELTACSTTMMLASDKLRVVLITTHLPLRDVSDSINQSIIVSTAERTRTGLAQDFGIPNPRIALCALNPHAGDGGLFGTEDETVLRPAAQRAGIEGPFPADTVFVRAMKGEFDAVLTPAHDVGMTAIKVASFGNAVNVTLGLPFPRTSPDHGTAIDIAGKGLADPSSFRRAVSLAAEMVRKRL